MSDETPDGATIGTADVTVGFSMFKAVLVRHLTQNAESFGSWAPHLWQYIFSIFSVLIFVDKTAIKFLVVVLLLIFPFILNFPSYLM